MTFSFKDYKSVRLELKTWPEVDSYLDGCKGIIIPIGSTEQHGPTGAIGTDALTAQAVALEVGLRTGVMVTPIQSFGMAEHHLGFAGTISLRPSTFVQVIHDLVVSLATHGFEKIFIINGHGGNIASTKAAFAQAYSTAATKQLSSAPRLRCKLANWFMTKSVFKEARSLYGENEGQHATPSEISLTLYLEPALLPKQRPLPKASPSGPIYGPEDFRLRYPDGRMGSDPFLANPKHGEVLLEKAASSLSQELFSFLEAS